MDREVFLTPEQLVIKRKWQQRQAELFKQTGNNTKARDLMWAEFSASPDAKLFDSYIKMFNTQCQTS